MVEPRATAEWTHQRIQEAKRETIKETLRLVAEAYDAKIDQAKSNKRDLSLREIAEELRRKADEI